MNKRDQQKEIQNINLQKQNGLSKLNEIYNHMLSHAKWRPLLIFRTKRIPFQLRHWDLAATGEDRANELHFSNRIPPRSIMGIVYDIESKLHGEQSKIVLKMCQKYGIPLYNKNFDLVWPKE